MSYNSAAEQIKGEAIKYVAEEWNGLLRSVYFGHETNVEKIRAALEEAFEAGAERFWDE